MLIIQAYIIALRIVAVSNFAISVYAWRHRENTVAARSFSLLLLAIAIWAGGYSIELEHSTVAAVRAWGHITYLGVTYTSLLWFIFAVQYADWRDLLSRRNVCLLSILPTLSLIVNWTNQWHHWYYTSYQIIIEGDIARLQFTRGALSWFFIANSYLLLLLGTLVLAWLFIRSPRPYRNQLGIILTGAMIPWLANIVHLSEADVFLHLDTTPMAFSITGVLIAWGLFKFRLFDIVPIARDKVMENIHDGVIILDNRLRIVDLNAQAEEFFPITMEALVGRPIATVLSGQLGLDDLYQAEEETHTPVTIMVASVQCDYDLYLSPLRDQQEKLSGWLLVLHDVTERNRYVQDLRQQAIELEKRNAELDAFAHTVAHDLKNPLTTIIGFSLWLEKNVAHISTAKSEENLQRISKGGQKMVSIIDELLLLSNVRSKDDINIAPLDMADVVAAAQHQLSVMIAEYHSSITVPEVWPTAMGYAPWIEEVWVNYISNALKYGGTPPQVILGATRVATTDKQVTHYRFWVRDNGAGLSAEQQNQLFTEFTRLEQTRALGHGLGLSIVKRIIEKLDGQVGVESEVSGGSKFWFDLPVNEGQRSLRVDVDAPLTQECQRCLKCGDAATPAQLGAFERGDGGGELCDFTQGPVL